MKGIVRIIDFVNSLDEGIALSVMTFAIGILMIVGVFLIGEVQAFLAARQQPAYSAPNNIGSGASIAYRRSASTRQACDTSRFGQPRGDVGM
jgi:hypothetical protein